MNLTRWKDGTWEYESDGCGCCSDSKTGDDILTQTIIEEVERLEALLLRCKEFLKERGVE